MTISELGSIGELVSAVAAPFVEDIIGTGKQGDLALATGTNDCSSSTLSGT